MSFDIKTSDYVKPIKVNMDGKPWTMTPPGAGTEIRIGQIQRRMELLTKKVDAGTATEEELDRLDDYEMESYKAFAKMFRDDTPDNTDVQAWIDSNPVASIYAIIQNIKEQVAKSEANTGKENTTGSDS